MITVHMLKLKDVLKHRHKNIIWKLNVQKLFKKTVCKSCITPLLLLN